MITLNNINCGIFESIDYSFWGQPKWTINTDEGSKDGSDALLYVMLKYVKETKNTDFSNISISELKKILISNVEIRASQIVVIEYIHSKLINISPIDINGFFFVYSKKIKSIAKPYHLCRNTNY